jgi:putative membrane protein
MKIPRLGLTAILLVAAASGAQADPESARHFLHDALGGDNSEMMLGQLAADNGTSPGLRAYGKTLHDDHARAREQTVPLAKAAGVPITEDPMPEAAAERRKLEGLRGPAFDREFARYMVQDHKNDISEFRKQALKRGPTADLAKKTLPVLRKHLAMAQRLSRG